MRIMALILALSMVYLNGCAAVQERTVTDAIGDADAGGQMETKFCPQCGRRFIFSVEYCPYDGAELQSIEKQIQLKEN